jgi:hypothetical protein
MNCYAAMPQENEMPHGIYDTEFAAAMRALLDEKTWRKDGKRVRLVVEE